MPKSVDMRVIAGEGKDALQVGDHAEYGDHWGVVIRIDVKVKWVFITLEDDSRFKVPRGSEINVLRDVQTEEDLLADRVEVTVEWLTRHQEQAHKAPFALFVRLQDHWTKQEEAGYLFSFDLGKAADIAAAQRVDAVWLNVLSNATHLIENGTPDDVAWLRAAASVRAQGSERLTARYTNPLSRSTSVISNLEDDLMDAAWKQYLDDTKYLRVEILLADLNEGVA